MKYIYGPLKSRRLGYSLGVTTVPYKVCSFDCVYCQLGPTVQKIVERQEYIQEKEILKELQTFFDHKPKDLAIDYVTFSGSGEPMLNTSFGRLVKGARRIGRVPIALITNSSFLVEAKARKEAASVDLIVPSLDAVTQDVFEKIDRPAGGLRIRDIIAALKTFRKGFKGTMWLEVMLVRGLNDSPAYLKKIKRVVDKISPDRVQLNSPVRVPAQKWVQPPLPSALKKAKEIFGENCDVV